MASQQQAAGPRRAVAFLGPAASYTHQAAKKLFAGPEWDLVPVGTITDVFDTVASGRAVFGVVPFENSTHGPVVPALAGLADRDGAYAALSVCGEASLAVHHCLLGRARTTRREDVADGLPLVSSLDHVARVYSHPQAFGQTAAWVRRHLGPTTETIETSSTSRAATLAAADATGTSGAIAGALAAETSGLAVLARSIEDRPDNTTRFLVLGGNTARTGGVPWGAAPAADKDAPRKHLVSFTVPHRSPGALADVLACFRRGGLNLTSINSVPSLAHPFQYVFLVEFEEGAVQGASEDDPVRVQQVLAEVAQVAQTLRLLGTWTKPGEAE